MTEDKLWSLCISRCLRCDVYPRSDWECASLVRRVYRIALLLTMALSVTGLAQAQQGGPPSPNLPDCARKITRIIRKIVFSTSPSKPNSSITHAPMA